MEMQKVKKDTFVSLNMSEIIKLFFCKNTFF